MDYFTFLCKENFTTLLFTLQIEPPIIYELLQNIWSCYNEITGNFLINAIEYILPFNQSFVS